MREHSPGLSTKRERNMATDSRNDREKSTPPTLPPSLPSLPPFLLLLASRVVQQGEGREREGGRGGGGGGGGKLASLCNGTGKMK